MKEFFKKADIEDIKNNYKGHMLAKCQTVIDKYLDGEKGSEALMTKLKNFVDILWGNRNEVVIKFVVYINSQSEEKQQEYANSLVEKQKKYDKDVYAVINDAMEYWYLEKKGEKPYLRDGEIVANEMPDISHKDEEDIKEANFNDNDDGIGNDLFLD